MDALSIANLVTEVLIALIATVGNTLIIVVIFRHPRLRSNTNYFIANLALADLMVGVLGIPSAIVTAQGLPNNYHLCIIMLCIIIAMTQVSIFGLLMIATDKFIALWNPYLYHDYVKTTNVVRIIILTWLAGLLVGMVPLFGWSLDWPAHHQCFFEEVIDLEYMVYFNFFVCVLLPMTSTIFIYTYVLHIVRKQNRQITSLQVDMSPHMKNIKNIRKDVKAARCLTPLIICFAICWLPIHIINTLTVLCPHACNVPLLLKIFAIWLSHVNSAINPFLYAYGNAKFKSAFRHIICHKIEPDNQMVTVAVTRVNASVHNNDEGNA